MTMSQVVPSAVAPEAERQQPAAAPPPARPPRPARRHRLTLPARLAVETAAALLALAALCVGAILGAVSVRADTADLRVAVAQRASVAAELRFALADLDAQRADQLVPGHAAADPDVLVGNRLLALITAQQRRREISALLRELGSDTSQAERVRGLLDALGRYDDASGRAGYADEQQPDRAAGHPPAVAVALSAEAGDIMRTDLLPTAEALTRTYNAQAVRLEGTAHAAAVRAAITVGCLGVLDLVVLVWWQRQLGRRYHRVVNPALLVATCAVLAVTLTGVVSFVSAAADLETAASQGLQPWSRLAEARAVAADAAASESRWLVDDSGSAAQQRARFAALTGRLDTLLAPAAYGDVRARYQHFRADDRELQRLLAAGRLDSAAALLTNVSRGNVAFDFWDFATSLDRLAAQQESVALDHISAARSGLDAWPAVPAAALGLAAVLVLAGVRPRFAEYR
jgi:hypothetical protein